jgi:protein-tyrosine phosphatase
MLEHSKSLKYKILFVCTGNICRSPSAEGVFRDIINQQNLNQLFYIDSCGTHGYHAGQSPDSRSQYAAMKRGIDISQQIARTLEQDDFNRFDYILAMDNYNLSFLQSMADEDNLYKIHLFLEYDENSKLIEIPDPYYGGEDGFEIVLDLLQQASIGLIKHLKSLKT